MANAFLDPLDWRAPIVDKGGRPTTEFQRKWAQQRSVNGSIPDLTTVFVNSGVGITGGGPLAPGPLTLSLAPIANVSALANISGAPAAPVPVLFSAITGVGSALKWTTARNLSFTGDATGTMSVDGSANASAALTLANTAVTPGTYGDATHSAQITVDSKGRVTNAVNVVISGGGGGGGGMSKIAQVVAAGSPATITFSAIPSTFTDLLLVYKARTTNVNTQVVRLTFNADNGNNYSSDRGNRFGSVNYNAGPYIEVGNTPGTNTAAGQASNQQVTIPSYTDTLYYKGAIFHANTFDGGGPTSVSGYGGGVWANTAAVTQIDLALSAGNFANGSIFTLYGMG